RAILRAIRASDAQAWHSRQRGDTTERAAQSEERAEHGDDRHGTGGSHQGVPWTGIAQRRTPNRDTLLGPQLRRTGLSAHGAGRRRGARLYRRRCLAFVQRIAGGDVESVGAVSRAKSVLHRTMGFRPRRFHGRSALAYEE